ncbi:unnamed protein product [Schistosoma spindalis]|nr:unnamed protein product [Schistosoma spindale]
MSHKQGKLSPNTPQANPNAINRNAGLHALEYEEAMEVEQPLSDTSEHDPSSDASQDEQHPWFYNATVKGCCGTTCEQTDASVDAFDENDEARASGVIEGVFENILHHKQSAARADVRVVRGSGMIRCLPWKILVIFHPADAQSTIGVFVQCNAESESLTWSCTAKATIQLVAQRPNCKNKEMKIQHTFTHKENDWGFQQFISYDELLNPERGFISPTDPKDTIIIRAHIKADAPHGADWDSKRHTGFVGLKNQGATCYLNSLLQALYCTNKLRRAVFLMPTESDDAQTSVPLALQRVFYELQFSSRAVGTKKLTRSFGWATLDSFMQHDAQELCRVLLDNLENKMKGTSVEDVIPGLFCGKMLSYINCINVPYSSKREENFYDIQLKVNGNRSVYDAFNEYIAKETLSQDNKYDAGAYGLQEAEKGVIFTRFPPVLYLQLMRFQYDFVADTNIKLNDRFEFPPILKLDQFLAEPKPSTYKLHAVLVHSGDNHGGHYVVYINPALNGIWYQFDDDVVSRCSPRDAIDMNFGGSDDPDMRLCTNAYMLVYIADSAKDDVLCPVSEIDIPETLRERFMDEQKMDEAKRKQKEKVHLYVAIQLILEEDFYGWQGPDLCSQELLPSRMLRVQKQTVRPKLLEDVASVLHYQPEGIRLWRFQPRRKNMPTHLIELCDNQPLCAMKDALIFFVQSDTSTDSAIPRVDKEQTVIDRHLFFLKYFDPFTWTSTFCGHVEIRRDESLRVIEPIARERVGLPSNCKLMFFQDDSKSLISEITQLDIPISKMYKRDIQGQILYFQAKSINCSIPLPFGLMETTEMGKEALSSLVDDAHILSSVESPLLTDNSQVIGMNGIAIPSHIVDDNVSGNADVCRDISESSVISLSNIDSITLHKMATFPAVAGNKSRSCMNLMGQPITADLQTQTISSAEKLTIFDYFGSYIRQFEILLVDKLRPQDAGILIQVSADLTYWEFANVAAAYLSTQSNRLQFFRSQQGFGNTTDAVNAPIYVSPVSTGTGVTGSELASPPISSETTENTCGNNNVCSVESGGVGVTGTRGSPIHPHLLTAKSSGFPTSSPYLNSLVAAAAAQGLMREPPGPAISSSYSGTLQEFFLPFTVAPTNTSWASDVGGIGPGLVNSGNTLSGTGGNTPTPDRFPIPLNRFCGAVTVSRSPLGPVTSSPPRRVYYAHLAIRIDELETMRQVRVIYVGQKLSEKAELILSVPQNGLVLDLLKEASRHLVLPPGGSGQLRLLKISRNRIIQEYPPTQKLSLIPESAVFPQTYAGSSPIHSLRIEEIPLDEINLKPDETVVYVSHFDKAFTETFGVPFTVRIRDGENYTAVRERIRKRLEVPEKEFDRWRFAVIYPTEGAYIPNEGDPTVQIKRFTHYCLPESRPWLGIDHKPSKRPRYAPNEKPIKIHN